MSVVRVVGMLEIPERTAGDVVAHSSVHAFQGSLPAGAPDAAATVRLARNNSTLRSKTNAPMVDTMFSPPQ